MNFHVDEILGRRLPGVLFEEPPEFRVADTEPFRYSRHGYVFFKGIAHDVFRHVNEPGDVSVPAPPVYGAGHEHQPEQVVYDSGEQLLEIRFLPGGSTDSLIVEIDREFVVTYMEQGRCRGKETGFDPVVYVDTLESDPVFVPAGIRVRHV